MGVLDWRDRSHVARSSGRCVTCGRFTILLNDSGQHQHKVCAEAELGHSRKGRD